MENDIYEGRKFMYLGDIWIITEVFQSVVSVNREKGLLRNLHFDINKLREYLKTSESEINEK